MGFDIVGSKPTSERGAYLYLHPFTWPYLVYYFSVAAPHVCADYEDWYDNWCGPPPDGPCGVHSNQANELAEILKAEVETGRSAAFFNEIGCSEEETIALVQRVEWFAAFARESGGFSIS